MMKALILAAGLGSRLRPYTDHLPKPLFPIDGVPLLDRLIFQLRDAGCNAVAVNTHHLHEKIEAHIAAESYGIKVFTRHEPEILGTGGAIRNLSDFWDAHPFLVVNSDISTDIDFRDVFERHCRSDASATLVLVDAPPLNTVTVAANGCITGFLSPPELSDAPPETYTFTGIQVLDPRILPLIPENTFYSSIDAYRRLIRDKTPPRAYLDTSSHWQDLGTPDRYKKAVRNEMASAAFRDAFGRMPGPSVQWTHLEGDGSDRVWYRLQSGSRSLVASDHGIRHGAGPFEIDAFVSIGRHLSRHGLPVPRIHRYDLFSGWVFMEDVGDDHLQAVVKKESSENAVLSLYRRVLDTLILFSTKGIDGFDTGWTCQSAAYDRELILERECAYFVDSFLKGYLGLDVSAGYFESSFVKLAEGALSGALTGLMHRDFQSRNILVRNHNPRIIDFQGARVGPIQYDMASLLIDPYAGLSESLQEALFAHTVSRLSETKRIDPDEFRRCYEFCRITRNLQMLGAFGFLSRVKGKRQFEQYIPPAINTLKKNLSSLKLPEIAPLKKAVDNLKL
jgi:aminoglycoside/choline kinase family phosphotransferase/dTDP-glucose pyrophosphorylase